jgi:hypothetical protein
MNPDVLGESTNISIACGSVFDWLSLRRFWLSLRMVLRRVHFGFDGIGSRMSGEPPRLRRNFTAVSRLRLAICFLLLRQILRSGAEAAGAFLVMAK